MKIYYHTLLALAMGTTTLLTGCNNVPASATTTASVAGGDWVEYSSPKATDITIESARVNPDGTVEITGLKIAATPDEAVVNKTAESDAARYQMWQSGFDAGSQTLMQGLQLGAGLLGNAGSSPASPSASTSDTED
ncbi:MAG: hypothetical protein ACQKBW_13150 [Puniceicoccales bacterium]